MRCQTTYAAGVLLSVLSGGCVALPAAHAESDDTRVSLEQGWSPTDRDLFYHQTQGSVVLPYEWFLALEQPEIKFVGTVGLFQDPEYLSRFGFLADVNGFGGEFHARIIAEAPRCLQLGRRASPQ